MIKKITWHLMCRKTQYIYIYIFIWYRADVFLMTWDYFVYFSFILYILFSSLSSGLNSMATNTLQDILGNRLKNTVQAKKTLIAKVLGMETIK